jgi:S1-C subfamily serine protease
MSSLQKDDDDDDDDDKGERREKQKEEKIVVESSIRLMMIKMMMMKTMTTMMKGDDDRSQSSSRIEKSSMCKVRYKKTSSKMPAIVSRFLSSRHGSGVLLSTEKYAAANKIDAFNREDFFVLTAAHVASMAGTRRDGLECVFPFSSNNDFKKEKAVSVQAEIFSVHERLDLALLRVVSSPSSVSSVSSLLSSRGLELSQKRNEKMKETQRVRAFGFPMAYANPFFSLVGDSEQSNGEIIGYSEDFTHVAHTATVSSGCSGGPLLDDDGYVLGVHSFGDKFYGGEADVAACCFEIDLIDMLNKPAQSPSDWDTSAINEKIMKRSLKAMREIFPDIPEKEAKKWIL